MTARLIPAAALGLALSASLPQPATTQSGPSQRIENTLHAVMRASYGWQAVNTPYIGAGEWDCAWQNRQMTMRLVQWADIAPVCPQAPASCAPGQWASGMVAHLRDPFPSGSGVPAWVQAGIVNLQTGSSDYEGRDYPNGVLALRVDTRLHLVLTHMMRLTRPLNGDPARGHVRLETGLVGQITINGQTVPAVCRRTDLEQLRRMATLR